jgi:hypothetical protein
MLRRMRKRVLLAALLLASLFCVGFARRAQERPRWEYRMACGRPDLTRLGDEGWELATATQDGNVVCLYFKRQK